MDKEKSFEESLEELELVVSKMEGGNLPLSQMIECFEKGVKLVKACEGELKRVERKIELLVSGDEWRDFDGGGDADSAALEELF